MNKRHILMDGSHLLMTLREINRNRGRVPPKRIDYPKLVSQVLGGCELGEKSTIYISTPPTGKRYYLGQDDRNWFWGRGFAVREYPLKERLIKCDGCRRRFTIYREKTVDAALITGMFCTAAIVSEGDRIVLVSGDGDFYEAVSEIITTWGVRVDIWGFREHSSRHYKNNPAIDFNEVDQFLDLGTTRINRESFQTREV